jgi:hypothetical protein
MPSWSVKRELAHEDQTLKKQESDLSAIIKQPRTSSASFACFLYCEKCQLKYKGGCPEHLFVYIDHAETPFASLLNVVAALPKQMLISSSNESVDVIIKPRKFKL